MTETEAIELMGSITNEEILTVTFLMVSIFVILTCFIMGLRRKGRARKNYIGVAFTGIIITIYASLNWSEYAPMIFQSIN